MKDRFEPPASSGPGRPGLIVHLFVDCVDTLHRSWPRRGRRTAPTKESPEAAASTRRPAS